MKFPIMTTADQLLNMILADSCSCPSEHEGFQEFVLKVELHCTIIDLRIVARCVNSKEASKQDDDAPLFQYEIKSIERL